jgi:hypothetical protein
MSKFCESCGMPLERKEDCAQGDENAQFCVYCVNADGRVKACEEVFQGGVQFFMDSLGGDRAEAEKITRKNMSQQPYWQGKDCEILKGEMATDEEFAEAMKKL